MTGKMTVNLAHTKLDQDRDSLGEILAKAINATHPGVKDYSERDQKREAAWIVRWAIRSVSAEIIRTGKIGPLPLKVRFVSDYEDIPNSRLEYGGDYTLN